MWRAIELSYCNYGATVDIRLLDLRGFRWLVTRSKA